MIVRGPSSGCRYELGEQIAHNGVVNTFLARSIDPEGLTRAVRILRLVRPYADERARVHEVIDQACRAARIRHPNVAATLDVVAHDGEVIVVAELIPGVRLRGLGRGVAGAPGRKPASVLVRIISDVLLGLDAAHAQSAHGSPRALLHSSASPEVIQVGADGVSRLDGLATAGLLDRWDIRETGSLYIKHACSAPPEVVAGHEPTLQSGVWLKAYLLLHALPETELGVADGEHWGYRDRDHTRGAWTEDPSIPRALRACLQRALAQTPADRFPDGRSLADALALAVTPASSADVAAWVARSDEATQPLRDRVAEIEAWPLDRPIAPRPRFSLHLD